MVECFWITPAILFPRKSSREPRRRRRREKALKRLLCIALERGYTIFECSEEGAPYNEGWLVGGGASKCFMEPYRNDASFLAMHIARRTFGWGQCLRILRETTDTKQ